LSPPTTGFTHLGHVFAAVLTARTQRYGAPLLLFELEGVPEVNRIKAMGIRRRVAILLMSRSPEQI